MVRLRKDSSVLLVLVFLVIATQALIGCNPKWNTIADYHGQIEFDMPFMKKKSFGGQKSFSSDLSIQQMKEELEKAGYKAEITKPFYADTSSYNQNINITIDTQPKMIYFVIDYYQGRSSIDIPHLSWSSRWYLGENDIVKKDSYSLYFPALSRVLSFYGNGDNSAIAYLDCDFEKLTEYFGTRSGLDVEIDYQNNIIELKFYYENSQDQKYTMQYGVDKQDKSFIAIQADLLD